MIGSLLSLTEQHWFGIVGFFGSLSCLVGWLVGWRSLVCLVGGLVVSSFVCLFGVVVVLLLGGLLVSVRFVSLCLTVCLFCLLFGE